MLHFPDYQLQYNISQYISKLLQKVMFSSPHSTLFHHANDMTVGVILVITSALLGYSGQNLIC